MPWGLLDRNGNAAHAGAKADARAAGNIYASLPEESREDFTSLLREACDDGVRRRFCFSRPNQPLIRADIVPLSLKGQRDTVALVIVEESRETDGDARSRKLARRNEAILRSSMDGFFVVDADCRFLEVNEAFCGMVGYTADELLRMRITDLEVDAHENGGVPSHTQTGLHHFPTAHRHHDGHLVYLEISVNVHHDENAKILVGFARDVTERKRAEEALAQLSREQKLILESAADGIAGLDRHGRFTFLNGAATTILGAAAGALIGRPAHEVLFGNTPCSTDARDCKCALCATLKEKQISAQRQGEFCRADGRLIPVEYCVSLMHDESTAVGAVLTFKDLTEQRRVEQERRDLETQMQQAQKLESLGLLAGGVAHDLNNTLVGVQGNACLALEQTAENSELHRRLQRIIGACQRASKVIQQMLAYAGHVTCETAPLDMNHLLEEMMEFMRAVVPKAIVLETRLESDLPNTEADSGQLQQVITNLLINAIEAIGDKPGRIDMVTDFIQLHDDDIRTLFQGQDLSPGRYISLQVSDNGCGMTPDTLQRIFEPFYSQKGAGRGLGLAAIRGIIRAHRGGITVESTMGEGTRFTILLPALQRPALEPLPAKPQTRLRSGTTVLVIDDETEVREVVRDMLSARGMEVLTAKDGFEALALYKKQSAVIDVILLDMAMPGMNGDEVLRHILEIQPDARVIVSSGFIEENIAAQFGNSKPAGFLYKPFTPDSLMERIGGVLQNRGSLDSVSQS